MNLFIQSVEVVAPESAYHRQKVHIWIQDGIIKAIGKDLETPADAQIIQIPHLKVSIGWCDMRASLPDPGLEHKETLQSGRKAAAKGGFTQVIVLPNTQPSLDSKDALAYIQQGNRDSLVSLHPIGAVTLQTKGENLSDMIDLHHAGAVAFSDGLHPIWHSDIMVKSLMYLQKFDGLLINRPEDLMLTKFGVMNEGVNSTQLGLKGMPSLAEEMMIRRDIDFLTYAGGKLHFTCISSTKAVALIREAKQAGLRVTCDVAAHQLAFDDTFLNDFDTNYKVNPPFRTNEDRLALWKGLEDGTIDAIVSDHQPHDQECKQLEFDLADFGVIGLETAFQAICTYNQTLSLEKMIDKIAYQPRHLLQLDLPKIEQGASANLTFFDEVSEGVYEKKAIVSLSKNSPFINKKLKGKIWGVIANQQAQFFS